MEFPGIWFRKSAGSHKTCCTSASIYRSQWADECLARGWLRSSHLRTYCSHKPRARKYLTSSKGILRHVCMESKLQRDGKRFVCPLDRHIVEGRVHSVRKRSVVLFLCVCVILKTSLIYLAEQMWDCNQIRDISDGCSPPTPPWLWSRCHRVEPDPRQARFGIGPASFDTIYCIHIRRAAENQRAVEPGLERKLPVFVDECVRGKLVSRS